VTVGLVTLCLASHVREQAEIHQIGIFFATIRTVDRQFVATTLAVLALAGAARCGGIDNLPTQPTAGSPVIVAFGDSLTAGPGLDPSDTYPVLLQRRLRQSGYNYGVVNAGVTGDTSTEAVRRLDQALVPDAKIMIVELGINDGLRGMPTSTLEQNLATVIQRVQARAIAVLLCGMEAPPLKGFAYSIEFHRVFTRLAERYKLTLVPFFLIGILGDPDLTLADRAHPNAEGHKLIADALWPYLEPMLAK
jgi:acyl-CoA thioesterase-1